MSYFFLKLFHFFQLVKRLGVLECCKKTIAEYAVSLYDIGIYITPLKAQWSYKVVCTPVNLFNLTAGMHFDIYLEILPLF